MTLYPPVISDVESITILPTDQYTPATSDVLSITIVPVTPVGPKPTTLSVVASVNTIDINQNFTISGRLTSDSGGVQGHITLQQGATDVTTTTADTSGNYSFTLSEATVDTYNFRTVFAGTSTYAGSESPVVSVIVTPILLVPKPIPDYAFEVRQRVGSTYNLLGVLSERIMPSLKKEIGMADVLTFNLRITDPNYAIFTDNFANLEVWYYGRDYALKQVFVPQYVEPYRDYGGTGTGSGSGALGSGSGDMVLITCDGPETYLSRYYTENYKISQRAPSDILNDITLEARQDYVLHSCIVDPSLDAKLLDLDLSWENLQTAVNNIIAQTGGYMQLKVEAANPARRDLYLLPIPGQLPQPVDTGATSPVLPQARRELLAREGIEAPTRREMLAAPKPKPQLTRLKKHAKNTKVES